MGAFNSAFFFFSSHLTGRGQGCVVNHGKCKTPIFSEGFPGEGTFYYRACDINLTLNNSSVSSPSFSLTLGSPYPTSVRLFSFVLPSQSVVCDGAVEVAMSG